MSSSINSRMRKYRHLLELDFNMNIMKYRNKSTYVKKNTTLIIKLMLGSYSKLNKPFTTLIVQPKQ